MLSLLQHYSAAALEMPQKSMGSGLKLHPTAASMEGPTFKGRKCDRSALKGRWGSTSAQGLSLESQGEATSVPGLDWMGCGGRLGAPQLPRVLL